MIAAGSLLEFVLSDHTFSMPAGRVSYLHTGLLTFLEFLGAKDPYSTETLHSLSADKVLRHEGAPVVLQSAHRRLHLPDTVEQWALNLSKNMITIR